MRTATLFLAALFLAAAAHADSKTDLYGDPLPDGAVLRLGTVQFRVPNIVGVGIRPSGSWSGPARPKRGSCWRNWPQACPAFG